MGSTYWMRLAKDQNFCSMPSFPAKVLLFGEYTVLAGSQSLALPFPRFSGRLQKKSTDEESNLTLQQLAEHIRNCDLQALFKHEMLETDLREGLHFISNIPQGYGLGSSGALTAAIYHAYADSEKLSRQQIVADLAAIEAYFHGQSSGTDPAVSYFQKPWLNGEISEQEVQVPITLSFLLIDTGKARQTAPFMQHFKTLQTTHPDKVERLKQQTNRCIHAFLKQDKLVFDEIKDLAIMQAEHLQPMLYIPTALQSIAKEFSTDFTLKICGAGGGGFLLGVCKKEAAKQIEQELQTNHLSYHLLS